VDTVLLDHRGQAAFPHPAGFQQSDQRQNVWVLELGKEHYFGGKLMQPLHLLVLGGGGSILKVPNLLDRYSFLDDGPAGCAVTSAHLDGM